MIENSSLDESFSHQKPESSLPAAQLKKLASLKQSIKQLKSIMLTLEWDMSTAVLQQLDKEIANRERSWRENKTVSALLRILRALGKYILIMQAKTHPVAVKLFFAVYNGLEKVVLSPAMPASKKRKIVVLAHQRYNEVRQQLEKRQKKGKGAASTTKDKRVSVSSKHQKLEEQSGADFDLEEVMPALSDFAFSEEDEGHRQSWYEKEEGGEVSQRLDSFFVDKEEESASNEEIAASPAAAPNEESATGSGKSGNIIDQLFARDDNQESNQLLNDIHLSFLNEEDGSGRQPPSEEETDMRTVEYPSSDFSEEAGADQQFSSEQGTDMQSDEPPSLMEEAGASEQSSSEEETVMRLNEQSPSKGNDAFNDEISSKLDSFFGDAEDAPQVSPAPLPKEGESDGADMEIVSLPSPSAAKSPPSDAPAASSVNVEPGDGGGEFEAGLEQKLNAFFDEEGESVAADMEIVSMPSSDQPPSDVQADLSADAESEDGGGEFADGVEQKLDAFFDEEGESDAPDMEIASMPSSDAVQPPPPVDEAIEAYIRYVKEETDNFRAVPDPDKLESLTVRSAAVEKSLDGNAAAKMLFLLSRTALSSCRNMEKDIALDFLKLASRSVGLISGFIDNSAGSEKELMEVSGLLEEFLKLKERQVASLVDLRVTNPGNEARSVDEGDLSGRRGQMQQSGQGKQGKDRKAEDPVPEDQ
jgi:hypothetical protein